MTIEMSERKALPWVGWVCVDCGGTFAATMDCPGCTYCGSEHLAPDVGEMPCAAQPENPNER